MERWSINEFITRGTLPCRYSTHREAAVISAASTRIDSDLLWFSHRQCLPVSSNIAGGKKTPFTDSYIDDFPIETSIFLGNPQQPAMLADVVFWRPLVRSEVNKATPPLKVPVLALASGENTKPEAGLDRSRGSHGWQHVKHVAGPSNLCSLILKFPRHLPLPPQIVNTVIYFY